MKKWCSKLLFLLILSGCYHKESPTINESEPPAASGQIKYATGFTIETRENNQTIVVYDPWQNAQQTRYSYLLSDSATSSRMISRGESIIKVPVERVVCLSTTHIGFIDYLGKTETIIGISGIDFVVNDQLRNKIDRNMLSDVGFEENLSYELLLKLNPDIVFAYGVTAAVTKVINKLYELNIPVVLVAEYLEEDPLAKMEWIKFFAAFYGLESEVNQRFDSVVTEYNCLTELASAVNKKPKIIMGLPWRGTWYISGGQSYAARLIADAGGDYLWKSLDYKDSRPIELEKVYENALAADFWLNTGDARSKAEIVSIDERFKNLKAFGQNTIYNNNKLLGPGGGNAYFESGVVEPHIILADLMSILHPQLLPSHELKYYQKLQ